MNGTSDGKVGETEANRKRKRSRGRRWYCLESRQREKSLHGRAETERDGTRAETRFGFPSKRTSPFTSAGLSVQSADGSRGLRMSGSNAG